MHPLFHSRYTIAWEEDTTEQGVSPTDKGNEGQRSSDFAGWQGT